MPPREMTAFFRWTKSAKTKDGGNRPDIRFRVLCTSTGELSPESHLQKFDREIMAGQLVRCPSLRINPKTIMTFRTSRRS